MTALVTHAQGRIHAYELWNEVDYSWFWSGGLARMVQMSVDAAAIIHRLDPSAIVSSVTNTASGHAWLAQYLAALPAGTIDAIAVHSYTDGRCCAQSPPRTSGDRSGRRTRAGRTPSPRTGCSGPNRLPSTRLAARRRPSARPRVPLRSRPGRRPPAYWYAYENTQWGTLWDGTSLTPAGVATATLDGWLAGVTFTGCGTTDGNLWSCGLVTAAGAPARIVWVHTTPMAGYSTAGYANVRRLDGSSAAAAGSLTVTTEPVLLSA